MFSKKDLLNYALLAEDYDGYKNSPDLITSYANSYCEALDSGNRLKQNIYFSCLVLKLWYQVRNVYNKIYTAGKTLDDAEDILADAIFMACSKENRSWQKGSCNAQAVINQIIATRGVAHVMYESNLQKNRGKNNVISLDALIKEDSSTTMESLFAWTEDEYDTFKTSAEVKKALDAGFLVEGIVMDYMTQKDCWTAKGFSGFETVKMFDLIDDNLIRDFADKYRVDLNKIKAAFNAIKEANTEKRYKYINKTKLFCKAYL
jgi:hypothetical protein